MIGELKKDGKWIRRGVGCIRAWRVDPGGLRGVELWSRSQDPGSLQSAVERPSSQLQLHALITLAVVDVFCANSIQTVIMKVAQT